MRIDSVAAMPRADLARAVDHTLARMVETIGLLPRPRVAETIARAAAGAREGVDPMADPAFDALLRSGETRSRPVAWTMQLAFDRHRLAHDPRDPTAVAAARKTLDRLGAAIREDAWWRASVRAERRRRATPPPPTATERAVAKLLPLLERAIKAYEGEHGAARAAPMRTALTLALAGGSDAEVRAAFGRAPWDYHAEVPATVRDKARSAAQVREACARYGRPTDEDAWNAIRSGVLAAVRRDRGWEPAMPDKSFAHMVEAATIPGLARVFAL